MLKEEMKEEKKDEKKEEKREEGKLSEAEARAIQKAIATIEDLDLEANDEKAYRQTLENRLTKIEKFLMDLEVESENEEDHEKHSSPTDKRESEKSLEKKSEEKHQEPRLDEKPASPVKKKSRWV